MLQMDKTQFSRGAWTGAGFQSLDRIIPGAYHTSNTMQQAKIIYQSPRLLKPRSPEMREVELRYREVHKNTVALQALVRHQEDELVAKLQEAIQEQQLRNSGQGVVQRATLCLSLFARDLSMWQLSVFNAWVRKVNERHAQRRYVTNAQRKHRLRIRCARALAYSNLRLLMLDVINQWHCSVHSTKHQKMARASTATWDDTRSRTRTSLREVAHLSIDSKIQSLLRLTFRSWYSLACAEIPLMRTAELHRASVEHYKGRYITRVEDAMKGLSQSHAKSNLFTLFHRWHIAIGPHGGVWSSAYDWASELRKLQTFSIPIIVAATSKNCEKEKKALAHFRDRQVYRFTARYLSGGLLACAFNMWSYQCKSATIGKKYRDSCVEREIIAKLQEVESQEIEVLKAKAFEQQDKDYGAAIDIVGRTSITAKTTLGAECEVAISETIHEYEDKMNEEKQQTTRFLQEQIERKTIAIAEEKAAWAERLRKREEDDKKSQGNMRKSNEFQLEKIQALYVEQINAETMQANRMSMDLESSKKRTSLHSEGKAQIVQQTKSNIAEHLHKVAKCKEDIATLSATVAQFRALKGETQKLYDQEIYALDQYVLQFVPFGTLQTIKTRPFFVGDKYVKDGKILPAPDMELKDSPRSPKGKNAGAIWQVFNLPNRRIDDRYTAGLTTPTAPAKFDDRSRSVPPQPKKPAVFTLADGEPSKTARLPGSPAPGVPSFTTALQPKVLNTTKSPATVRPIGAGTPLSSITYSMPVEVHTITPPTANKPSPAIRTPIQTQYTKSYVMRTQQPPQAPQQNHVRTLNTSDPLHTRSAFLHQNAPLQPSGNRTFSATPHPSLLNHRLYPNIGPQTSPWYGSRFGGMNSARSSTVNAIPSWREMRAM
eukprot:GEMP01001603.1.p1 GENE.GEMP01001603.1~~GEMP01001603.1.p1  ORF type:complete len:883 (+),score=152.51 GEMP01001603.1:228-2876(+)